MLKNLKYLMFAVVCGLLLTSTVAFAQNNQAKTIVFPEVEGWEKGDKATYPTAEFGYSIPYTSITGGIVTIYVYNGGLSAIPDGIDNQNVKDEMKKSENDIVAYGEAGYYQNVKLVKSELVNLGGATGTTQSLYSLFSFKVRGADVDSEIYLFGYKNNFIKLRATRPKGRNGAQNSEVDKLLLEIGKLFG